MTREEILAMEPGRELDALIEQHVFGKKVEWIQDEVTDHYPIVPAEYGYIVENYSTDISAAWEVEEKIKEIGGLMIGYYMTELLLIVGNNGFGIVHATPEQRCKSALLAVLGEEE